MVIEISKEYWVPIGQVHGVEHIIFIGTTFRGNHLRNVASQHLSGIMASEGQGVEDVVDGLELHGVLLFE